MIMHPELIPHLQVCYCHNKMFVLLFPYIFFMTNFDFPYATEIHLLMAT